MQTKNKDIALISVAIFAEVVAITLLILTLTVKITNTDYAILPDAFGNTHSFPVTHRLLAGEYLGWGAVGTAIAVFSVTAVENVAAAIYALIGGKKIKMPLFIAGWILLASSVITFIMVFSLSATGNFFAY